MRDEPDDEADTRGREGSDQRTANEPKEQTRREKPERASKPKAADGPDFGPRYRLIGILGKGGMGEVYRAFDLELREEVALKVVRGDAFDLDVHERFRREIALARKVTDPHVLRVYDLAEHDGLQFLSMEFVDGESLAALLKREGRLPLERAFGLFRQICQGLIAAHAKGVVHRDLKPQNVLVGSDDRVWVADFGLARSMADSGLTATGVVLGSPMYMSPEQVKGDPVDERSDIYSMGVLLYQLVSGKPAFEGTTPHAVMEMRLHKKPRPLRELVPDLPAHIEAIVMRCLVVDPTGRYRSVRDLVADLDAGTASATPASRRARWLMPAVGGGALMIAGVLALALRPWGSTETHPASVGSGSALARGASAGSAAPTTPADHSASVASPRAASVVRALLIRMTNTTGDAMFDKTLEVGLEIELHRSRRVDPLSGLSLQQLAASLGPKPAPIDEHLARLVAQKDGRRAIALSGELSAAGPSFVLSVTARDGLTGDVVLEKSVQAASEADIIPAISQLAIALRAALGEPVAPTERSSLPRSIEALNRFALGFTMARTDRYTEALPLLERAVELEPTFALGQIRLALIYSNQRRSRDATRHFERALASLDSLADRNRLRFLGLYHREFTQQYDRSIAALEELQQGWPNEQSAAAEIPLAYAMWHKLDKALEASAISVQMWPSHGGIHANHVNFLQMATRLDEAATEAKRALAMSPRPYHGLHLYLGAVSALLGRTDDATESYRQYRALEPSLGVTADADLAMFEGRYDAAAELLASGIEADLKAKLVDAAERKSVLLAELRLRRGDRKGAIAAAAKVTGTADVRFLAALVLIEAGESKRALATAAQLAAEIAPDPRAYAKLIEGEVERAAGKATAAILLHKEARAIADVWLATLLIGRASLDAGLFADAHTELTHAIDRRGEIAVDGADVPGLRHIPQLTYYLARAQQGLGSDQAAASYRAFLAMLDDASGDALVADAKRRLAALK